MKNTYLTIGLLLGLLITLAGCGTLNKDGYYAGDKILYDTDLTISMSYEVMHTFVKWEYDNRALLASKPEVKKAADNVRKNARQWISTAIATRDTYKANPTDATKGALEQAMGILRLAITEATRYMVQIESEK